MSTFELGRMTSAALMGWNKPPVYLCHGTTDDPVGAVQDEVCLGESGQGGAGPLRKPAWLSSTPFDSPPVVSGTLSRPATDSFTRFWEDFSRLFPQPVLCSISPFEAISYYSGYHRLALAATSCSYTICIDKANKQKSLTENWNCVK
jgi:hypothetical protein